MMFKTYPHYSSSLHISHVTSGFHHDLEIAGAENIRIHWYAGKFNAIGDSNQVKKIHSKAFVDNSIKTSQTQRTQTGQIDKKPTLHKTKTILNIAIKCCIEPKTEYYGLQTIVVV